MATACGGPRRGWVGFGLMNPMRGANLPRPSHKEIVNKEAFEQLAAEAGLADEPNNFSEQTVGTTTLELETERIYHTRPLPMVRHWLTRCFAVAVVTLAMPYLADLLHPADSSEEHVEETEVGEGAAHPGGAFFDMLWTLLLLLVLISLALVFERLREMLEESLGKHAAVVERIWSELVVLGSLSLVTGCVLVQGGVLGRVSLLAYGDKGREAHLLYLFGAIHLSLLCGLVRLAARHLSLSAPCPCPPSTTARPAPPPESSSGLFSLAVRPPSGELLPLRAAAAAGLGGGSETVGLS